MKHQVLLGLSFIALSSLSFASVNGVPCSGVPGSYHINPDTSVGGFVASSALVDSSITIGEEAAPCGGAAGKFHVNPNGSAGGFVANSALVSKLATIELNSIVCDKVKINGSAQIKGKSEILGFTEINGNVQISGSKIYSSPVISGNSVIIRSVVCQASRLNSLKVIDSSYYCNVDDPEPKDPGEAGKMTLLGGDSDGDGVRDDVEIWLNRTFSNTPQKSYTQELSAAKIYSKNISDSLRMKSDQEFLVVKWREDGYFDL